MNKIKKVNDVRGYKINCANFNPCPLCFGCRNADPKYIKCEKCMESKYDICNTDLHTEKAISMMVPRQTIKINCL